MVSVLQVKIHVFLAANVFIYLLIFFYAGDSGDDARRVQHSSQLETAEPKEEQRPLLDL